MISEVKCFGVIGTFFALISCAPNHFNCTDSPRCVDNESCIKTGAEHKNLYEVTGATLFLQDQARKIHRPVAKLSFEYGDSRQGISTGSWHVDWIADRQDFGTDESICQSAYYRLINEDGLLRIDFENIGIQIGYRSFDDTLVIYFGEDAKWGLPEFRWQYYDVAADFCGGPVVIHRNRSMQD